MNVLVTTRENESVMSYHTITETQPPFPELMRRAFSRQEREILTKMAVEGHTTKPRDNETVVSLQREPLSQASGMGAQLLETFSSFLQIDAAPRFSGTLTRMTSN